MARKSIRERTLPDYTRGEEIFNMVSHIVGGGLSVVMLVLCVVFAALWSNAWLVVGCSVYGASLVLLYTVSSIYHGLRPNTAKRVFRVLDHCTIYFLIAGTYTPILLGAVMPVDAVTAWVLFGVVWGLATVATVFTAVDMERFTVLSMICYIGIGWSVLWAVDTVFVSLSLPGFVLLLAGGVAYTVGAVLYGIGKKKRYMHSVFHLFVIAGSLLQFFCIFFYVL